MPTNPLNDLTARLRWLELAHVGAVGYFEGGSPWVDAEDIAHFAGQIEELERTIALLKGEL